jgi:molybdopterin molybdotransferase
VVDFFMEIEVQLTGTPIAKKISPPLNLGAYGVWLEFRGVVRGEENSQSIAALEYEAYPEMAERQIRRLLEAITGRHPCLAAKVIHRVGIVPVGEAAIYLGVAAKHRAEAIALLGEFMDGLKKDVPIWKRRALPVQSSVPHFAGQPEPAKAGTPNIMRSLDEATTEINSHCHPLPPVSCSLDESFGRVLRETVCASEGLPANDRSTRDGYAILADDISESFQIVDTIHAADWKPRQLKSGETVRVATGAALPCDGVRVVMQENVERNGDHIRIKKREAGLNLRKRGEDVKAGLPLVQSGVRLDAGKLALLATAGCTQPLVSPRVHVAHFTTGDEIVSPDQTPKPGQIRNSNSILIRGLLQKFSCDLEQKHLPENFEAAWAQFDLNRIAAAELVLVSGGASVGDKDFTRPLLERLGFEIIFNQVNLRPGKPLIFGVNGKRIAFGLPGNPLSHFVCFHLFVAGALAKLTGQDPPKFLRGTLAEKLEDAPCPRETLWPSRLEFLNGELRLCPLKWSSSGDVKCLAETNALILVSANRGPLDANVPVDFLPTTDMMNAR